jgi:hypothetical protein
MVFLPLSSGVFRLTLAGSSPGIPCRGHAVFKVHGISIQYPLATEQEVFVPVLRPFFGFYGQKPEALVPANHWIAFIIAEISLNFQEVAPPV